MKHKMIPKLLAYGVKFLPVIPAVLVLSDPASKGSGDSLQQVQYFYRRSRTRCLSYFNDFGTDQR